MAQQLKKKFIGNDQVDGSKVLLQTGQSIRAKDSFGTEKDLIKFNGSDKVEANGQEIAIKSVVDSQISTEQSARVAGDAALQVEVDAVESALAQEVLDRQADVNAEESRAISAESALQSSISSLSSSSSAAIAAEEAARIAGDAATLSSANSYADQKVADLVNSAPAVLDTLKELADAIAQDPNFATTVATQVANVSAAISAEVTRATNAEQALSTSLSQETTARQNADSALQGEIDAEEIARAAADATLQNNINAEESARIAADSALDARVDVLESVVWFKEKFAISNGQTSVTLSHTPELKSMSAFVDRLAIHEGASEDYTISGTTMTFLNDLVSPGQSSLGNGDTVYVKYQYKA